MKIKLATIAAVMLVTAGAANPTADRVSRTFARMARSTDESPETVRILFYGQSIVAQDWGRKFIVPELKKRHPTVNFVVENRALGGYEAPTLIKTAEADLYPFYPDLLFFHVYGETDKYIEIVRRVRERTTADVVLWTSHLNAKEGETREKIENLIARPDTRSMVIRGTADRYGCMFVDLRTKWCRMLLDSGKRSKEMLVDGIHMKAESLPIYANMLTEDLPFGCFETKNALAGTVLERPGALRLAFTGNRVIAVSDGRVGAEYDVLLDGKPVQEHGAMWTFTRTTSGIRNTKWPMLSFVNRVTPSCAREKWTLELIEGFNETGTVLPYKLTGSLTGPDGVGCNTNRFVSNSGKVEILPSAWPGFTGRWGRWNYLKARPAVGLKVEWENVPMFVAPYRPGARHEETVLVQGCANGSHVLELKPRSSAPLGILKFRTYAPVAGCRPCLAVPPPAVAKVKPADGAEACRPAGRFATAPWWTSRLAETRGRILKSKGTCYDLVMVGDSITHRWENKANGAAVYVELQKKYKVLNLGSGGDRTQNVIWRFENNGELDDYTAKVFAVMIGVNNGGGDPDGTVAGVKKIVGMIREKHPESKILLQAILPHGKNPRNAVSALKINPQLKDFAQKHGFSWLDMTEKFLDEQGEIKPGLMMPDNLHPINAGYEIWLDEMSSVVDGLLGRNAPTAT